MVQMLIFPIQSGAKSPVPMASCLGGLASGDRNLGNRRVISHMISKVCTKNQWGKRWKTWIFIDQNPCLPAPVQSGLGNFWTLLGPNCLVFTRKLPSIHSTRLQESPCWPSHLTKSAPQVFVPWFFRDLFRSDGAMEVTSLIGFDEVVFF